MELCVGLSRSSSARIARWVFVAGVLMLGVLPGAFAQNKQAAEDDTSHPIRVPGTKVWLAPPPGFLAATAFAGFQHVELGASIMVNLIPGPFSEAGRGLADARNLAKQGMEVLSREDCKAGAQPGFLLHARQSVQGGEYEKWMWCFGSEHETVLVLGIYPTARSEECRSALRTAVLSARWDPDAEVDPFDGLGFSLGYTGTLKFFTRIANMIVYSADGESDLEKKGKATFLMGPAIASVKQSDRRSFVQQRLRSTAMLHDFEMETVESTTIDALEGFELVATAVSDTDVPKTVYQIVLFEGASCWIGQGQVRTAEPENFLPMFRKIARSFSRENKLFESDDGLVSVRVPSGWTKLPLNKEADLQVGHSTAELYLIILSESKAELEAGTTILDHSQATRKSISAGGQVTNEVGPRKLEVGGLGAVQYELHVSADGKALVFLHTTIESPRHFHQVLAWTRAAGFTHGRAVLDAVIASVRVKD